MPAIRALLVVLDEWVANGREPPPSRLPRIADGTLVRAEAVAWPKLASLVPPRAPNDVVSLGDWTDPQPPSHAWQPLVPQVDADGNEIAGIRLPDIAVPRGTFTGWNLYKAPLPEGELADREGTHLAFATTRAERDQSGDPRLSVEERYPTQDAHVVRVREVVTALLRDRLLLREDAEVYLRPAE
jgi:hypothetical protein